MIGHKLPSHWEIKTFREVAEVITGTTPSTKYPEYYGGTIPFVTPSDLDAELPITQTPGTLTELGGAQARLIPPGSVMVCCIGATIGKVGFAGTKLSTNQQINSLVFDQNRVYPQYAYQYCRTLKPLLKHFASSTTLPIVNKSLFQEFQIPLPPLDEQKRIAAILSKADRLRRLRRYARQLSDGYLQSVFLEMFGDPVSNPRGWERAIIGDVVASSQYGTSNKSNSEKRGYPILGMGNITYSSEIDLTSLAYVELSREEFETLRLEPGDIIFNRTNSTELVGKTAHWKYNLDAVLASYLVKLKLKDNTLPDYFTALLNTRHYKQLFQERCRKAVGQSNISPTLLKEFPVLIPPLPLQQKFAQIVQKYERLRAQQRKSARQGEQLFQSLLHRAFRGEL